MEATPVVPPPLPAARPPAAEEVGLEMRVPKVRMRIALRCITRSRTEEMRASRARSSSSSRIRSFAAAALAVA